MRAMHAAILHARGRAARRPTCVSLELRKGMCGPLRCSAATTSPSALRLRLIACASLSCSPAASLRPTRSDPARKGLWTHVICLLPLLRPL